MDQNKLCFYFLFNEVRGFFSSFNIQLFFFLNDVPLEEKMMSFVGTGRCEKLHFFQLWLASPTLKGKASGVMGMKQGPSRARLITTSLCGLRQSCFQHLHPLNRVMMVHVT